jgi:hypothetical protein
MTSILTRRKNEASQRRERFLEEARSHLGYRPRPGGLSDFGQTVGYSGHDIPWDGAFVDVVARAAEVLLPACVNTSSGLAELVYSRRVVSIPRPGDIVFYSFPATGMDLWSQPHVGIVTGVIGDFRLTGRFTAIEAQTGSGLPKDTTAQTGVFERVRWRREVIAFARPNFKRRPAIGPKNVQTGSLLVRINRVRPGRGSADVQTVQLALTQVAGLEGHEYGLFDGPTRDAYARWQRMIGRVGSDATGDPDPGSLARLGRETGLFEIK